MTIWDIAKWPVMLLIIALILAILYYAAPNVRQPGFRWVTPGGILAVCSGSSPRLRSRSMSRNFSSYNKTYGALGCVVVFLVWLWITNIVILLGAELNAEIERGRQIEAGHPAEREPFLPTRSDPAKKSQRASHQPEKARSPRAFQREVKDEQQQRPMSPLQTFSWSALIVSSRGVADRWLARCERPLFERFRSGPPQTRGGSSRRCLRTALSSPWLLSRLSRTAAAEWRRLRSSAVIGLAVWIMTGMPAVAGSLLQLFEHAEAVDSGHPQIKHDDIWRLLACCSEVRWFHPAPR